MKTQPSDTAEHRRLAEDRERTRNWKRWGPYVSERQWATVREDYSPHGNCWDYFPHDHARSRTYRWGEDGLLDFTDRQCRLCFALALWNGRDPILKERLFGLTGPEGNHGEDVKECYYYLDSTPTHSSAKALYKYPHAEFPYARLVRENRERGLGGSELELADTGVFDEDRYFDVFAEYAKASPEDICIRITIANRGPDTATLHVLPTLWFRNTWSWGTGNGSLAKPTLALTNADVVRAEQSDLGTYLFSWEGEATALFTENESNAQRLWNQPNATPFVKDAFHECVVHGHTAAVNPEQVGTKCAPHFTLTLAGGETRPLKLRLVREQDAPALFFGKVFDQVFTDRQREADEFYNAVDRPDMTAEAKRVARQGYAGLLWSKQFYHYVIDGWLKGDARQTPPPTERLGSRNVEWPHLYSQDIISMPDKWEYPWFAAWDLAFHMIPMAQVDPDFAKHQLQLNGQGIPLCTRSLVGLLPLIAVEVLEQEHIDKLPGFAKRMKWFIDHRPDLTASITMCNPCAHHKHRLLAIPSRERLERTLRYMLDETEFLSPFGLRSVSRVHKDQPYVFRVGNDEHRVDYTPGEGNTYLFGGNSNWRGPIWFPINYLIIEALERYHHFYGDGLKVECPVGSGTILNLEEVARELSRRHARLFLPNEKGARPCHGPDARYTTSPHWNSCAMHCCSSSAASY